MTRGIQIETGGGRIEAHCGIEVHLPSSAEALVWEPESFDTESADHSDLPSLGAGRLLRHEATREGLRLTRESFFPEGSPQAVAVRLCLQNETDETVEVESLSPVVIGSGALKLGDVRAADWVYLRQPRYKNDMPAAVRLGSDSSGIWDAVRGTPETGGVPGGAGSGQLPRRFVGADLTVLATATMSAVLGVFPLDQQLARSVVQMDEQRRDLESFRVDCLCDRQQLKPGETLTSQWVLMCLNAEPVGAITRYRDLLLAAQPQTLKLRGAAAEPPAVWCSWYYYGDGFSQEEMEANLDALEKRPLSIDVILIDECWDIRWGDWTPNERWPDLPGIARRIRKAGYEPGIWTCPMLAEPRSTLGHQHRDWLLRKRNGQPVTFFMNGMHNHVLDPTHPEVLAWVEALYRRLTHEWGFTYHKLDFLRSVAYDPDAVFGDRLVSRAQAYRRMLEVVRRAIGPDAYLSVCGGLYGPSLGLADSQRTGSDVQSVWPSAPVGEEREGYGPFTIKQNTLRFWMNGLWQNDPDALMVRRRADAWRGEELSLGLMSGDEALTSALNQYLGGGLVCFTENLAEVDGDRLMLLRHCAPSLGEAAVPRDAFQGVRFPSIFDTAVSPRADGLPPWHTVSLVNWFDESRGSTLTLDTALMGHFAEEHEAFLVSAFTGAWHRVIRRGESITVPKVNAHACEVLKIQPLVARQPKLVRTDGHFSMGGTEITRWEPRESGLHLEVVWPWPVPLELEIMPPDGKAFATNPDGDATSLTVRGPEQGPVSFDLLYA